MLPHNDGFPVVTVGFIQFIRPSTHVLARKRTGVNDLEGTEHSSLQNEHNVAQLRGRDNKVQSSER